MSSRSLAAARARRAGENAPPVSGNRPITSIGSQASFVQPGYQTNMPQPPPNVRVSRGGQQNNAYKQVQQSQQQSKNGLPFSKLSIFKISDFESSSKLKTCLKKFLFESSELSIYLYRV